MIDFYDLCSQILEENEQQFLDAIFDSKEGSFVKSEQFFQKLIGLTQWPSSRDIFPIVQDTMVRQNASKLKPYAMLFPIFDLLWYIAERTDGRHEIFSPSHGEDQQSSEQKDEESESKEDKSEENRIAEKMTPSELMTFLRNVLK